MLTGDLMINPKSKVVHALTGEIREGYNFLGERTPDLDMAYVRCGNFFFVKWMKKYEGRPNVRWCERCMKLQEEEKE